jgi:hypothetical protein
MDLRPVYENFNGTPRKYRTGRGNVRGGSDPAHSQVSDAATPPGRNYPEPADDSPRTSQPPDHHFHHDKMTYPTLLTERSDSRASRLVMDSESGSSTLSLSYRGPAAIVKLNRPYRGNGLNGALKTALRDVLDAVGADDEVRAVVLTGAGRSFCVGQDLEEHAEALAADPTSAFATVAEHYNPVVTALAQSRSR